MGRRASICALVCAACGRVDFDANAARGDGAAIGADVLADAPGLPSMLACSATRTQIAPVPATADLAVGMHASDATAMWNDAQGVKAMIDARAIVQNVIELVPSPVDQIAGLVSTGMTTLFVTQTGTMQTLWKLNATNDGAVALKTEASMAGRDPFMNDYNTGIPRTWMRGEAGGLRATFVDDQGVLKSDVVFPTSFPVTALSSADNFGHGHMTWSEDRGGGLSHCEQADIDFPNGVAPVFGGSATAADDCYDPRMDSGPNGTDSIVTVFRSAARTVEMTYRGGSVNTTTRLSEKGRAAKVRYDGTWIWAAWIDEAPNGDVLRVAKVAQDLTFEAVDVPGWMPAGDESFELVRTSDSRVHVVLLGSDTLSFVRTCP